MRVMSSSRPAARVRHTGRIVVPVLGSLLSLIVVTGGEAQQRDVLRTDPTTRESIAAEPERRGYFRSPALRGEVVVFTAEGDLWKASVSGGAAVRLTTHAEVESNAAISPDGRAVAFSAAYEGPREVYLMPMDGGPAERQTWEGGNATVAGWTPDGRILYSTSKYATLPGTQLVALKPCVSSARVAARHVCAPARDRLPFAGAALAAFGPDGTIWFTRWPKQGSYTKRYVGGTAENIWRWSPSLRTDGDGADASRPALTTTSATEAVPVTGDYPGTSTSPMYWNGRLWFASDRARPGSAHSLGEYGVTAWDAGVMNIWSMSANGGDVRQHTFHDDFDVAQPSMHEGRIVYQHGADLRIIDVRGAAAESRRIDITLPSDFDQMRENWVERPMDFVTSAHVSPDGDRVVLTSRGRVFVAPVGAGRRIEVVREQGVRYREARFMPDGRTLMALSDESGEVELWTLPANGIGERAQLTKDATILRWDGVPSPDGRYLAHHDKNQDLWLYDTKAATDRRIGHSERESAWISSAPGFFDMEWSPDGRWLAYNDVTPNFLGRIVVYDTESDTHTAVTTDRYDSWSPAWSPDGKWLWFLSDRTFQSSVGSPWGPRQPDPYFDRRTRIYAVALTEDAKWPFRPKDEMDSPASPPAGTGGQTGQATNETARTAAPAAPRVVIDLDGLETRLYEVPGANGNYSDLATDGKRLYWMSTERSPQPRRNLMSIEITRENPRAAAVMEDAGPYELSVDRRKLMVRKGNDLHVFDAGARAPQDLSASRVDLAGWKFSIEPREEWRHHFIDAWRLERDYFYDPGMHGIDWPAMREKYLPLALRVTDRNELNDVIAQMVGELSTLHIFVRGGDVRDAPDAASIGSLGAALERDTANGGWRIAHIYRSDPDLPGELAPLAQPGLDVAVGDVITRIDGVPTLAVPDPHVLLRNTAGRQVRLTLRPRAPRSTGSPGSPPQTRSGGGRGSAMAERDVIIEPITQGRESNLRYTEWEYTRRLAADSMSGGRIGYVHLRAMSAGNIAEWTREYYPVFNRDALIIDVRHNSGGNIDSWLLGKLLRREWFWWQPRVGEPYVNMPYAFRGPIVVLVDQRTASDGEAFAEGFRRLGLGKVIGVRTWGGEIWLSSSNFLADRGIATAAEQGVYADGEWLIEGWGLDPGMVVDNLPVRTFEGGDAQLEAAVRSLLDTLASDPPAPSRAPAYPNKGRRGSG